MCDKFLSLKWVYDPYTELNMILKTNVTVQQTDRINIYQIQIKLSV